MGQDQRVLEAVSCWKVCKAIMWLLCIWRGWHLTLAACCFWVLLCKTLTDRQTGQG